MVSYKIVEISEGRIGALLFGGSNLPLKKVEKKLNEMDAQGYDMVFQVVDTVRNVVFWQRQRVVMTFKKRKGE